ncbi:hypothetical protein SASPL_121405 [Salvia splendens]|uniref:UBX domain-containing protein 1 n=1 Tax=Salvia splendens TaxID=180675 RepID=A0A8X8XX89_SALSN|nr:hypothetical protein SASPL_121405 [Salvia splendens]
MASRDKKPSKPSTSRTGGIRTLSDLNRTSAHDSDSDSDGPQEYYTGGEKRSLLVISYFSNVCPNLKFFLLEDVCTYTSTTYFGDFSLSILRVMIGTSGGGGICYCGLEFYAAFDGVIGVNSLYLECLIILLSCNAMVAVCLSKTRPRVMTLMQFLTKLDNWGLHKGQWRIFSHLRAQEALLGQEGCFQVKLNGFTVNDGPLRSLDDPENASFIESIRKSECPKELEPADRRSSVHVNLIRKDENRPEPEVRSVPFQGVGRTLGSSSATVSDPDTTIAAPLLSAPAPSEGLVVDKSLPSTSIQLRLADGTRMVAHFNHHHTIADIRSFIDSSRPGGTRSYQLQTVGFPPKVLTDLTQTIEQAGLLSSVIVQRL